MDVGRSDTNRKATRLKCKSTDSTTTELLFLKSKKKSSLLCVSCCLWKKTKPGQLTILYVSNNNNKKNALMWFKYSYNKFYEFWLSNISCKKIPQQCINLYLCFAPSLLSLPFSWVLSGHRFHMTVNRCTSDETDNRQTVSYTMPGVSSPLSSHQRSSPTRPCNAHM